MLKSMVSVIISTYKRSPEMVNRAATSVLNQTYENIELIIVDDSPSDYEMRDEVKNMAESLGDNVRYIRHEKNMGACAARNTGLHLAKGEFVAFLDDDDEWLPEKIEKQIEKFNDEDVALVYCSKYVIQNNRKKAAFTSYHKGYVLNELMKCNFVGGCSFPLIRKSVIEELGGFDIEMKAAQDYEMWIRIARNYKIDYVDEPLVNYYFHEGEQITKNHKNRADAFNRLNDLCMDYLKQHRKTYSIRLRWAVEDNMFVDRIKGIKLAVKAFFVYPYGIDEIWRIFKIFVWTFIK